MALVVGAGAAGNSAGGRIPQCHDYWEGEDEDGEANGEFKPEQKGAADSAWIAYIVAEK